MHSTQSIAQRLPDLPRWVEARALLLHESCEIFGLQKEPELSLVVRDPDAESVFIIGTPAVSAVQVALQKNRDRIEVVAPLEQATWIADVLPEWNRTRIIVHHLADPHRLPEASVGEVDFLDLSALSQFSISAQLRQELESNAQQSLIAATFVDHQPVSFCYPGAITESLWDIAIDTLPEHRRKGYAARCVAHMVRHMQAHGKYPVWQSVEGNPASWRLAQKLGFIPLDELVLFEPRDLARKSSDMSSLK